MDGMSEREGDSGKEGMGRGRKVYKGGFPLWMEAFHSHLKASYISKPLKHLKQTSSYLQNHIHISYI